MKNNKLDIKKSRIYLQHPDAKWFLRLKRKHRNICWVSLIIAFGCLLLLGITPKIQDNLGWVLNISIAVILYASLVVSAKYSENKPDPVMQDMWRLARELDLPAETLWWSDVQTIEKVGMRRMVSLAVDILDFEAQVERLEIKEEASAYLNNLILNRLDDHKAELKSRLSNIHQALRAFELSPEKYDWAFEEAKKKSY